MLLLASALKLIFETALMAFAGRWVLGALAGPRRDHNLLYQLLGVLTAPFMKVARFLFFRRLHERHVGRAAVLLLAALWVAALAWKVEACRAQDCLQQPVGQAAPPPAGNPP